MAIVSERRVVFGGLFFFAFWLFVALPFLYSVPRYSGHNETTSQCSAEESKNHGFWEKAGCDPTAYFTLWLVAFTGVLAVSTIGLWIVTWRASASQARDMQDSIAVAAKAADAAMLSARAAIGVDLPIVRMEIGTLGFGLSQDAGEETANAWVDHLIFANLGRTKAFPVEIRVGVTIGDKLPKSPEYTFTKPFLPDYIIHPIPESPSKENPAVTPRMRINDFEKDMTLEDQGLLVSDQMNLWFYCCLVWDDFMQTRHETCSCWLWSGQSGKGKFRVDQTPAYNRKT